MATYACCQHCPEDCPQRGFGHTVTCEHVRADGARCVQGGTPFAGRA